MPQICRIFTTQTIRFCSTIYTDMKKRLVYYEIEPYFHHKNAIVITGMRQVGKTTLMKHIFEELKEIPKVWFDFGNPLDQKTFEDIEYRNIYLRLQKQANSQSKRLYVFIDEIQNFPEITSVMKFLIDHFQVKFFVIGSSNFYLRNLFPESLTGRKFLYQLMPLSFKEFLYFHDRIRLEEAKIKSLEEALKPKILLEYKQFEEEYNTYLEFGGFPEVVVTIDQGTKMQILKNIYASFFEKDIHLLFDYKDVRELRDLILLLIPRIGNQLDISKLASELGVERGKIYSYLEFLQGVFFLRLLPRFSKSIDRSIAGRRKVYFADNGLLRVGSEINRAQLLENAVVKQLAHYGELSFFYKRNQAKIDIIIDKKIALEIKTTPTEKDMKRLKKLAQSLTIEKSFIVSHSFVDLPDVIYPMFL